MHPVNYQSRRVPLESGKFKKVAAIGVQRFDTQAYQGFTTEIGRSTVGITVKRASYSVTILNDEGHRVAFMNEMPSVAAAQQAARDWVDAATRRGKRPQRRPRPKNWKWPEVPEGYANDAANGAAT